MNNEKKINLFLPFIKRNRHKTIITLIVIYGIFVVFRLILRQYASPNPYIVPDEMLYYNLSRSLYLGQGLELHGQPVTFISLLYSLLLAPLYGMSAGNNLFGAAQIINILLMNLAVFPMYPLARRLGCKERTAVGICILSLLLPDLFMSGRYMTESLIYPLFLWTLLACIRMLEKTDIKNTIVSIFSLFLLYLTKEGGIAMTVAFCLIFLWKAAEEKNVKSLLPGGYIIVGFLTYALHVDFNTQTIYQTQYDGLSIGHILQTMSGMLLYFLFVPVGFGVLPVILPLSGKVKRTQTEKMLLRFIYIALLAYIAGVCYLIFCNEMYDGIYHSRIHLRYLFPFAPVFAAALFSENMKDIRLDLRVTAGFSMFTALILSIGLFAFSSGLSYPVDSPLLAFLDLQNRIVNLRVLWMILLLSGCALTVYVLHTYGWRKSTSRIFTIIFVTQLLIGNIAVYQNNRYSTDQSLTSDAVQVSQWLDGKNALLVSELEDGCFDNQLNAVDVQLRQPQPVGALEDVCPVMGTSDFSLPAYWVAGAGNDGLNPDYILCNNRALYLMVLDEECDMEITDNGYFVKVSVPADGVWLHSALAGLKNGTNVSASSTFWLYDANLLSYASVRLVIQASTTVSSEMILNYQEQDYYYTVGPEAGEYYLDLPLDGSGRPISVSIRGSGEITIHTYTIGPLGTE